MITRNRRSSPSADYVAGEEFDRAFARPHIPLLIVRDLQAVERHRIRPRPLRHLPRSVPTVCTSRLGVGECCAMSPDYRSLEVVAAREGTASKRQRAHSPAACERIYPPHGGCDRPDSDRRGVSPFQPVLAPAYEPAPTAGADGALAEKHQPGAAGVGVA